MLRKLPFSVLAPLLVAVGCARHTIPPVELINQTRIGPADGFGPGISGVQYNGITFELAAPANVIVLRVSNLNGIEQVLPLRSRDRTQLAAGIHRARTPFAVSGPTNVAGESSSECVRSFPGEAQPTPPRPGVARDSAGRVARQAVSAQRSYEECLRRERTRQSVFRGGSSTSDPAPSAVEGYWLLIVSDVDTRAGDLKQRLEPMVFGDVSLEEVTRQLPEALVGSRTTRWAAYYLPFGMPTSY